MKTIPAVLFAAVIGSVPSMASAVTFAGTVVSNDSSGTPLFPNASPGQMVSLTLDPLTLGLAPAPAPGMRMGNAILSSVLGFTELRSQVTMEAWTGNSFAGTRFSAYGHDLTPGVPLFGNGEPPYFFLEVYFRPGTFSDQDTPEMYKARIDSDGAVWDNVTQVVFDFKDGPGLFPSRTARVTFVVPEPASALLIFAGCALLRHRQRSREPARF